jgi:DNA repair protein RadC
MKNPILVTESFSSGRDTYFFDFRLDVHDRMYMTMACSQLQDDDTYKRASVRFWERDFEQVIQAFSSLFHHASYLDKQRTLFDAPLAAKGIKSWPPEFRPREKLAEQGRVAMANAELLAMLIGSGTPNETAVDLAERILLSVDHDLKQLFELSSEDLCRFRGMGMAKSSTIIAAMELSARLAAVQSKKVWLKKVL